VAITKVQARLRRLWRLYWLRQGAAVVLFAAGVAVYFAAVAISQSTGLERATVPLDGTGLSRVASTSIVGPELLPQHDPVAPKETRNALIVAADRRPLVGERLLRYSTGQEADLAITRAFERGRVGDVVDADGFRDVSVGCEAGCRPAKLGQLGHVAILLARLPATGSSDAGRGDAALAAVARRYGDRGLRPVPATARPWSLKVLVAAVGVALLFAPFAIWHGVVARRAPRTPHRHVPESRAPPSSVIDVCADAAVARRRGRRLFAAVVAVYAACAIPAALEQAFILLILTAAPLSWLLLRRFGVREPRVPAIPGGIGLVWSGLAQLAGLLLRVAALFLTAIAWTIQAGIAYAMPASIMETALGPNPFGFRTVRDAQDAALAVVTNAGIWAVLLLFMSAMATTSRLARRLRVAAGSYDQVRRPRPVLLYLRAFDDDPRRLSAGDFGRRSVTEIFSFRARVSLEEVVARELNRHGLVVAIAEPGTTMLFLPLGASRRHVSQQAWQQAVRSGMHEAALIIITVGMTEGLLWEVATATRQGLLDRVLFIVPPNADDEIRARWHACARVIAVAGGPTLTLPVDPASAVVVRVGVDGVHQAVVADRRDEHAYATAIARTVAGDGRLTYLTYQQFDPVTGEPLSDKSKLVAGLLGICLGGFGAGRFYIGDIRTGVLQLVITFSTCGLGWLWGLIDGVQILANGGHDAQGRRLRDG